MTQPMGVGALADKDLVFVRKFRWLLEGEFLDKTYVKSVRTGHETKQITFRAYEAIKPGGDVPILQWLEAMEHGIPPAKETLTLTTFDGCGNPIYQYTYTGIKVLSHSTYFDYSSSEAQCRRVVCTFDRAERKNLYTQARHPWTLILEGSNREFPVLLDDGPQHTLEQTQVDFLHGRTWMPGRKVWKRMAVSIGNDLKWEQPMKRLLATQRNNDSLSAQLLKHEAGKCVARWALENVRVAAQVSGKARTELKLAFERATEFSPPSSASCQV